MGVTVSRRRGRTVTSVPHPHAVATSSGYEAVGFRGVERERVAERLDLLETALASGTFGRVDGEGGTVWWPRTGGTRTPAATAQCRYGPRHRPLAAVQQRDGWRVHRA
ncbi:MAG: hypothetical protein NVS3B12_33670 [Acidimicrobiales bacterium]